MVICAALFAIPLSVLAIPALPSSFYGTVKLNNANVPDGTIVQAFIGSLVVAQGYTQMFQGDSYYALDVPADDTATPVIDGGREGDTIAFKVAGITANETGTWHSGTDVQLNLTVTSASTPVPLLATPTKLPTQTPIVVQQATSTPTQTPIVVNQQATSAPTPTPIVVIQQATSTATPKLLASNTAFIPSLETKSPDLPTITPGQPAQSSPVPVDNVPVSTTDPGTSIPIIALALILIIGAGIFVWMRRNK
jgi:hypothetical protein